MGEITYNTGEYGEMLASIESEKVGHCFPLKELRLKLLVAIMVN